MALCIPYKKTYPNNLFTKNRRYARICVILEGVDTLDAALDAGFVAEMKEKIRMHVAVRLNLVPSGNEKDTRRFLN